MARAIDSICFCPPERPPARDSQNCFERREEAENPLQPRIVERPVARRQHQIFPHGEIGEDRHGLGHIGDAEPGDVGRRSASMRLAVER